MIGYRDRCDFKETFAEQINFCTKKPGLLTLLIDEYIYSMAQSVLLYKSVCVSSKNLLIVYIPFITNVCNFILLCAKIRLSLLRYIIYKSHKFLYTKYFITMKTGTEVIL